MKDSANNTYQSLEDQIIQSNKEIEECNKRLDEAIEKCQRYKEYLKDAENKVNAVITIMIGVTTAALTYFLPEVI